MAFIINANVNGKIHWMHSGHHIYSDDSKFVACDYFIYDSQTSFAFSLLWMNSLQKTAMITYELESGKIVEII